MSSKQEYTAALTTVAQSFIDGATSVLTKAGSPPSSMSHRAWVDAVQEYVYHDARDLPEQIEEIVAKLLSKTKPTKQHKPSSNPTLDVIRSVVGDVLDVYSNYHDIRKNGMRRMKFGVRALSNAEQLAAGTQITRALRRKGIDVRRTEFFATDPSPYPRQRWFAVHYVQ